MIKKIIILSLCLLISFGALAQSKRRHASKPTEDYLVGRFEDNLFFSLGLGAQTYITEYYNIGAITDHFSPEIDLSLGKWFSPVLGLRLQASTSNARGYNLLNTPYIDPSQIVDDVYKMDFRYLNLHIDILFNLHSQFFDYNPNRFYELIPCFGMGWFAIIKDHIVDNEYAANAGIINQFRVSDRLNINLEFKALFIRSAIDGNNASRLSIPASAIIGVSYKFGRFTEFLSSKSRRFYYSK
ncbi:MAG: hypothetical protein PHO12_07540 [Bacteroidales bacterium]|nr:hypothetical protein [Bacteroidales bacterium]MDD4685384.1 hypothetical protein [Bacteroidales bacterium]